jgi:hypothetical protein
VARGTCLCARQDGMLPRSCGWPMSQRAGARSLPHGSRRILRRARFRPSPLVPDPRSRLYLGQYVARFVTVAQQCPFAKFSTPIVCCGRWNHICGIRQCPFHPDNTQQNQRFARRAWQTAELRRNASAPFVRAACAVCAREQARP